MSEALPKLPIGIQDFAKLRTEGYLYVDKTRYLVDLIDKGSVYFLSRPRRFGKSLTVSTFDALFSGRRELFEGLYAEEFFDRPDFAQSFVVRLDMSRTTTDMGEEELRASMMDMLESEAGRYGIVLTKPLPDRALTELLGALGSRGRVAVLVDEYDKPILDCLNDLEKAEAFRNILRGFYARIKADDANTRFVFMTGITKFTKTGVFSAMNNLNDISADRPYAAMLGYTQDELARDFAPHLRSAAAELGVSVDELRGRMKDYYDGFSFDGRARVYNPFSTLQFLAKREFRNFWFDSGSPSFLVDYVRKRDLEMEDFRGLKETEDFTSATEIETAKPSSFLFQSGYLTVREKDDALLTLDYPNMEVLSSLALLFMRGKYENDRGGVVGLELRKAMEGDDPAGSIVEAYGRILAAIPYDVYEREERRWGEGFYHAILLVLLWASQLPTRAENHSYKGRSDVEVEYRGRTYVIELKTAEGRDACERAAESALEQIRAKGYADRYPSATLIGIAVDTAERRVGAYRTVSVAK